MRRWPTCSGRGPSRRPYVGSINIRPFGAEQGRSSARRRGGRNKSVPVLRAVRLLARPATLARTIARVKRARWMRPRAGPKPSHRRLDARPRRASPECRRVHSPVPRGPEHLISALQPNPTAPRGRLARPGEIVENSSGTSDRQPARRMDARDGRRQVPPRPSGRPSWRRPVTRGDCGRIGPEWGWPRGGLANYPPTWADLAPHWHRAARSKAGPLGATCAD